MAQVDASIPLSAAQFQAPDLQAQMLKGQDIALNNQTLQQNQLKMQEQQAEAEAFKGADFSTPEGRNATLVHLMQKAPQAGMALMKQFGEMDKSKAQTEHFISQAKAEDLKVSQGKQKALADAALPAWNAYQKALSEGKPDQVARAEADKLMPDAISQVNGSGLFGQDELASLPRVFDPNKIGGLLMATGVHSKMIEDRLKEAQTSAAEETGALRKEQKEHPEKFHQTRETGAQVYEGKDGKMYAVNPNKPDEPAKEIQGPAGLHKPGTSGGGAAVQKANVRAASVAASANNSLRLLDSIQKEFGDEATTSFIFGEQPKGQIGKAVLAGEKQLVSAKAQKLDARANSFIDEAGPAFTGGLRVNSSFREFLLHQLPQYGDPPEVAKEKWKNFKENISGASNTFKKAYSGNPDYWSKDDKGTLVGDPDDYIKGGQPPQESSSSKPKARPNAGDEVNGYVFQGGDPNSQASWKKKGAQ
jgi:hypothetical protein